MIAIDTVKQMYADEGIPERFAIDLLDHLKTGYVCSWPSAFLMAKVIALPKPGLAWKITAAAGPIGLLARMLPLGEIRFVAFGRRNTGPLRVYPAARMQRLIQHRKS